MKNKEGLVISCQGAGNCQWKPGSLHRSQHKITSTTTTGDSLTLSLFDHITVSVSSEGRKRKQHHQKFRHNVALQVRILVQTSRCHAETIRLEIIRNAPHSTASTEAAQRSVHVVRSDLVKEVSQSAEEAQRAQERARLEVMDEESREFCQTKGPSLYQLLEEIRELALLDVTQDIRT